MKIFPAIRGTMGSWHFYSVRMSMRELSDHVKISAEFYDNPTLDAAIQRTLNEKRIEKGLVPYLSRQNDRFFSSIVVAALGGSPAWYPVSMEGDPRLEWFRDDPRLSDSFGVLRFDGSERYYALDGQHRLSAIRALVAEDREVDAPDGFGDEEISVLIVTASDPELNRDRITRYRRLFGNLNRYAKATDDVTNIIMDEDDPFAIITRRLISNHSFFQWDGEDVASQRIKMRKGKNLTARDPHFTSLEMLYEMNIALLSSTWRQNNGWNDQGDQEDSFKRFRPSDCVLNSLFAELKLYWDELLHALPVLRNTPLEMRDHAPPTEGKSAQDCVLFWPIGQALMAQISRQILDYRQSDPHNPTSISVRNALSSLSVLVWDAHRAPWKHLLLIPDSATATRWKIRNEDRPKALRIAKQILLWQLGIEELKGDEIGKLRSNWKDFLQFVPDDRTENDLWTEIEGSLIR